MVGCPHDVQVWQNVIIRMNPEIVVTLPYGVLLFIGAK
jgi:hypothetical protein